MTESLEQRIARVVTEHVDIVPWDPNWPKMFHAEKRRLRQCLPADLVKRIEHFGSTAVPGLAAKPIIDMLVEVTSLAQAKQRIVPILETRGYEYFWRPSFGDSTPPFYAWFIKRNANGQRTHHIHMVEKHFPHWERLRFRDYLIAHPDVAREYQAIKLRLAEQHARDRVAYTRAKTEFIVRITGTAKRFYETSP